MLSFLLFFFNCILRNDYNIYFLLDFRVFVLLETTCYICPQWNSIETKKSFRLICNRICVGFRFEVDINWPFVIVKSYWKVTFKPRNNNNNSFPSAEVLEFRIVQDFIMRLTLIGVLQLWKVIFKVDFK